jgi:putative transcriptional regulator
MISRFLQGFLLALVLACMFGANNLYAFAPAKGMLLVADEQLIDPRFRRGVILLVQHDAEGTVGLIVNRSSRLPLTAVLPQGSNLVGQGRTLAYGGPVEPMALLALVKFHGNPPEPADEIIDGHFITGLAVLDEWPDFSDEMVDYRVFVGYTGWAAGQLAAEIMRGDWHVLPADEQSLFAGNGEKLWERLLKTARQKK